MISLPKPEKRGPKPRRPIARGKANGKRTSKRRKKRLSAAKRADLAAGAACRARGVCEAAGWSNTTWSGAVTQTYCGGPLQWAHIIPRDHRRNGLRWRQDNCLCLCRDHHWRWTRKNYAEWRSFLYDKLGIDKVLELEREAIYGEKWTAAKAACLYEEA